MLTLNELLKLKIKLLFARVKYFLPNTKEQHYFSNTEEMEKICVDTFTNFLENYARANTIVIFLKELELKITKEVEKAIVSELLDPGITDLELLNAKPFDIIPMGEELSSDSEIEELYPLVKELYDHTILPLFNKIYLNHMKKSYSLKDAEIFNIHDIKNLLSRMTLTKLELETALASEGIYGGDVNLIFKMSNNESMNIIMSNTLWSISEIINAGIRSIPYEESYNKVINDPILKEGYILRALWLVDQSELFFEAIDLKNKNQNSYIGIISNIIADYILHFTSNQLGHPYVIEPYFRLICMQECISRVFVPNLALHSASSSAQSSRGVSPAASPVISPQYFINNNRLTRLDLFEDVDAPKRMCLKEF